MENISFAVTGTPCLLSKRIIDITRNEFVVVLIPDWRNEPGSDSFQMSDTLESGIDVGQGINIGPGKFVKKNKRRALNKRKA